MSTDVKEFDIINEIADLTGIKLDIISIVLEAYDLVILDKVLESQLADDDTDYLQLGSLIVDLSKHPAVTLHAAEDLGIKLQQTVKTGRDYLSESVVMRFNAELRERYHSSMYSDMVEHDPVILTSEVSTHDDEQ